MVDIGGINLFFNEELTLTIERFPSLEVKCQEDIQYLSGNLKLYDQDGLFWDEYVVEIYPSIKYPYRFPIVFETGGKIPRNIDWHIFESTGNCCIKIPPEEIIICKGGLSLTNFIESQLLPYLFNQTYKYKKGYYLNERSHGVIGFYDFYSQLLNEKDLLKILWLIEHMAKLIKEPIRTALCFCGSQKKYRKCHRDALKKLVDIGSEQLYNDVKQLNKLLQHLQTLQRK